MATASSGIQVTNIPIFSGNRNVPIENVGDSWFGLSPLNNPELIDLSTLTKITLIGSNTSFDVNVPLVQGQYLMILVPASRQITIQDTILNAGDVSSSFELTIGVRIESGISLNSYVEGPISQQADGLMSGFTVNFIR